MGGAQRTYRIYVPATLPAGRAVPLLVVLHAAADSADQMASITGFDDVAASGGFIAVYPDGVEETWNAGICCGAAMAEHVDDMGFVRALLDTVERTHRVDARRVWVVGASNGAILAYQVACAMSDRVTAVGSLAGTMLPDACRPDHPVSVIEIHGTSDDLVPYAGGPLPPPATNGVTQIVPPSPVVAQRWASLDGCAAGPATTSRGVVTTQAWSGCAQTTGVTLITVQQGTHAWYAPGLGPSDGALDATQTFWQFLQAHPRSG